MALLEIAGVGKLMDEGFVEFATVGKNAIAFVEKCCQLRFWARHAAS